MDHDKQARESARYELLSKLACMIASGADLTDIAGHLGERAEAVQARMAHLAGWSVPP